MAKKKPETRAKDIQKSLIRQLELKGADIEAFKVQVESYGAFFLLELEERARLKRTPTDKEAAKRVVAYNKQQLQILKQLNLSVDTVLTESDDESGGIM